MGIRLTNAPTKPGITYDKVFLLRLDIRQEHSDSEGDPPVYNVVIRYRTYGVDDQNQRHYSGEGIKTIRVNDWIKHCMEHHSEDMAILQAFPVIQDAVARLIAEHLRVPTEVI